MSAFEFVHAEKADYEVTELCRNLEVSAIGYDAWASRPTSKRGNNDERLRTKIRAVHERSRGCCRARHPRELCAGCMMGLAAAAMPCRA